ncbi:MAG: M23 family metallopeptidase, partial [Frankiaceae bacterium]|nr:M23 family metallopeptidase [Frankiaceae bacterium]
SGQRVAAGEQVGKEGNTGQSTGPHLHFEVRIDGTPVNPLTWLRKRGVDI